LLYHFSIYGNPNAMDSVKLPRGFFQAYQRFRG
jgi:hypothetical protein